MEKKLKIINDFYANELKLIIKEMEEYFRKKKDLLPLDAIYKIIIGPETEAKINQQKELTLELASQWNGSEEDFEKIVNENFKTYLKKDANFVHLRKRHEKFEVVKQILKETFKHKIRNDYKLLKGEGETYEEIATSSEPSKKEAKDFTNKEIELYNKMIDFLRNNRGIIAVPGVIRIDILEAVIKFYECVIKHLKDNVERIYGPD
ncbi:MAG: hypothetical protein ACTSO9_08135 [Candidatus Helarchaeota archaeon]